MTYTLLEFQSDFDSDLELDSVLFHIRMCPLADGLAIRGLKELAKTKVERSLDDSLKIGPGSDRDKFLQRFPIIVREIYRYTPNDPDLRDLAIKPQQVTWIFGRRNMMRIPYGTTL